ncbi:MAG: RNA polymerase sigma factor [Phycisphaerales bacterium]
MPTILQRITNRDQSAAEDCVAEYGGLIWRIARRYLDRAESEVEDAVQDVFLELWIHANRFDPAKGSEAAFVATLAHRRIIDRQRKINTQRKHEFGAAIELNQTVLNNLRISAEQTGTHHTSNYRTELARGFHELPESEQTAIWMSVYRGLSHRDISELTEVPVGTVKSRIRRAMIRLTKSLKGTPADLKYERSPS